MVLQTALRFWSMGSFIFFTKIIPTAWKYWSLGLLFPFILPHSPRYLKKPFTSVSDSSSVLRCLELLERSYLSGGSCADFLSELYRLIPLFAGLLLQDFVQSRHLSEAREYMHLHFKNFFAGAAQNTV